MSELDPDGQQLVRASIRSAVRSGGDLVRTLRELGWSEVVANNAATAYELLFQELGRIGMASAALDAVVTEGAQCTPERDVVVVYPRPGEDVCARLDQGDRVCVTGLTLRDPGERQTIAFPVETRSRSVLAVVTADTLRSGKLGGWQREGDARTFEAVLSNDGVNANLVDEQWFNVLATARRCLAHELLGICRRMLELSVDHARVRHQFGRPIGSFQAVRHRLAEMHVWATAGDHLARDAWRAQDSDSATTSAQAAKAYAGDAHRKIAAHAMQVCGGMGLTWEHPLPSLVRRGFFLDSLLGSASVATRATGEVLVKQTQPLPGVIPVERLLDAPYG